MNAQSSEDKHFLAIAFPKVAAIFSLAVGFLVLFGWLIDSVFLKRFLPGFVTMKPNTALCFVLGGTAFLLLQIFHKNSKESVKILARALAGASALIGIITLAEYILKLNFGIDTMLFPGATIAENIEFPGRMSPATALSFSILGTTLILFSAKKPERFLHTGQWLALLIILISSVTLIGYSYDADGFRKNYSYVAIALHTAITLLIFSIGILFAFGFHGMTAIFSANSAGGLLAQRLVPVALIIPFILGWLGLKGGQAGFYGTEFGVALSVAISICIFLFLIWWTAWSLDQLDNKRKNAERNAAQMALIVESSNDAIMSNSFDGEILSWNKGAEKLFDYPAGEAIGKNIRMIFPPERLAEEENVSAQIQRGESINHYETVRLKKGGREVHVSLTASPIRNEKGEIIAVSKIARDISQAKADAAKISRIQNENAAILASITDAFITIDKERCFIRVNPQAEKILKQPAENLLGKSLFEVYPQFGESIFGATFEKAFETGESQFLEAYSRALDLWLSCRIYPSEIGFSVYLQDITERKKAEANINHLLKDLEDIKFALDASSIVAITDQQGKITYANDNFCEISGYLREELIGQEQRLTNFSTNASNPEDFIHNFRTTIDGGKVWNDEIRNRRKDGTSYWVETTIVPYLDKDGKPYQYVAISNDITGRKAAEIFLRESEERFRTLFDSIDEGFALVEVLYDEKGEPFDIRYLETNQVFESLIDFTEMKGKTAREMFSTLNTIRIEIYNQVLQTGESVRFENYSEKVHRWFNIFASRVGDAENRQVALIFDDITERKHTEKNLAFLAELTEQLITASSVSQVVQLFGEKVGAFFGANLCALIDIDEAKERAIIHDEWRRTEARSMIGEYTLAEYVSEEFRGAMMSGQLLVIRDVKHDPRTVSDKKFAALNIGAFMNVPLSRNGQWQILIGIYHNAPYNWREDEIAVITEVVTRVWNKIERLRAEESLRFEKERLEKLAIASPSLIFSFRLSPDGKASLPFSSPVVKDMYGFTSEELQDDFSPVFAHLPPEENKILQFAINESAKWMTGFHRTLRYNHPIKGEIWLETFSAPTLEPDGSIVWHGVTSDVTESKRVEGKLREGENRLQLAVSAANLGIWEWDMGANDLYWSKTNYEIFGQTTPIVDANDFVNAIHPDDRTKVWQESQKAIEEKQVFDMEFRIVRPDGTIRWLNSRGIPQYDSSGKPLRLVGVTLDLTERVKSQEALSKSEEKLIQSQKLESIGRLAGGIAHDFNNMLTAINGYSQLALRKLPEDHPMRAYLVEIKKAGERSADLTSQLLAFSRRQILQPKILNINQIINDTAVLLRRLIGEDIQLISSLNFTIGQVVADPGQISQVIMNLVVNSRDAMPSGGTITIKTENVFLDEQMTEKIDELQPGNYVLLAISDTGTGIDSENLKYIFEPFYTTKEAGKGTGLGLATVYGVVSQSDGYINVESTVGIGTTFEVYLPRVDEEIQTEEKAVLPADTLSGTETVLLVEDEEIVRNLTRKVLESYGYTVLEAKNGEEALEMYHENENKIDLLLTDIVMPKMGGYELAERLRNVFPQLKILFASGYTEDSRIHNPNFMTGRNFIHKPFESEELVSKVREILNSK